MLKYLSLLFCLLTSQLLCAQKRPTAKQPTTQQLEKGKALAKNCIDCHASPDATLAGPLQRIRKIRTADYIYSLLKNHMVFADENKTAKEAFAKRGLQMPPLPDLSKADIKAILDYFDSLPAKK